MRLQATYRHPQAATYRRPGGAWDVPTLDEMLSARRGTGAPLVVDGTVALAADRFEAVVDRLAGGLVRHGVRRGDVVAWQMPNWWEAIACFRACWRCGAVAAPIHHQVGASEVEHMVDLLDPSLTVASPGMPLAQRPGTISVRAERATTIPLRAGAKGCASFEDLVSGPPGPIVRSRGSDIAVVLFTSGSTGYPKAVLHTQRSLAYKARSMVAAHGLDAEDAALMPSPLAHISGLLNSVLVPGTASMPVVLMEKWDPERALDLVAEHRVSFMIGPPTLFTGMMSVPGYAAKVQSLRVVSCGSMGVTPEFIDAAREGLGAMVKRTYGSTEAPTVTTAAWDDDPARARDSDGHSVGDAEIAVVDPVSGRPRLPGEVGEVWLRGPELFAGYGTSEQTAQAVRRGWFTTGDLGTMDEAGWLTICGRLKDVIIRGGENVTAAEVERVLGRHPAVRQVAVVGCPDERLGERVAACVVGDRALDVAECQRWFEIQQVARFKTPEVVVHLDDMPVLGVGKPDRAALRALVAATVGRVGDRSGAGDGAAAGGRAHDGTHARRAR